MWDYNLDEDACVKLRWASKAAQSDQKLWRKVLRAEVSDLMVIQDVRHFRDPASSQQAKQNADQRHTGLHASVQNPLFHPPRDAGSNYPDAFQLMRATCRTLLDLIVTERQTGRQVVVHVIWFCNAGRHRSVAFATVFHKVLSGLTRWRCSVAHLSRKHWQYGCCDGCQECFNPTVHEEKLQLAKIEVQCSRQCQELMVRRSLL